MTLGYLGTTEALKNKRPLTDVEVWQQPQGFTPIRVFKGFIRPGGELETTPQHQNPQFLSVFLTP